jgi:hypothetical protein
VRAGELLAALLAMAALGWTCAWWCYRHDYAKGWEAAATSPAADPEPNDDATVQWVRDLKEPAELVLDADDAELERMVSATVARAIGMGL